MFMVAKRKPKRTTIKKPKTSTVKKSKKTTIKKPKTSTVKKSKKTTMKKPKTTTFQKSKKTTVKKAIKKLKKTGIKKLGKNTVHKSSGGKFHNPFKSRSNDYKEYEYQKKQLKEKYYKNKEIGKIETGVAKPKINLFQRLIDPKKQKLYKEWEKNNQSIKNIRDYKSIISKLYPNNEMLKVDFEILIGILKHNSYQTQMVKELQKIVSKYHKDSGFFERLMLESELVVLVTQTIEQFKTPNTDIYKDKDLIDIYDIVFKTIKQRIIDEYIMKEDELMSLHKEYREKLLKIYKHNSQRNSLMKKMLRDVLKTYFSTFVAFHPRRNTDTRVHDLWRNFNTTIKKIREMNPAPAPIKMY